ncbi:MAG: pitrilysin family protein [Bacteroidota bacterium]
MKNLIVLVLLFAVQPIFAQIDRSKKPAAAPAKEFKIGDYEKFTLKNGLTVIVVENHKVPRVAFSLIVDRDPVREGNKAGYVSLAGQIMRNGTATRSKAQLDEEVDFIGASLSTSATSIFGSSLTKHQDKLLDLFTDVLYNPAFSEEELDKLKKQTLSGLKANQDDPESIASNVEAKLLYGSDHPYGEILLEEQVESITIEDLKSYYNTYFKPNISYLAIVGDITPKEAKKIVKKRFGAWERGEVPEVSYAVPVAPEENVVALVNRSNSVQTVLDISYPIDLKPGTPNFIQARVMNQMLGGSSSGRLFKNIRGDKGYTYGAYSSISSDPLVGSFNAGASVRTEVTDSAVHEFLYEMKTISTEQVPDFELQLAKNVIIGGFGRALERPQTIASFAINTERYSLPEDYYSSYVKNIQGVSGEDVLAIAKKFIKPENAYIIAVGKASEIEAGLSKFGEVKYLDMYGEEVDPALLKIPDGLTADMVIARYIEAIGGAEALGKIENVQIQMTVETMGQKLEGIQIQAQGMKSKMEVSMGGMVVMSSTTDGTDAAVSQMGNKVPLQDAQKEEQIISSSLFSEFYLEESGADLKLEGVESIEGEDAYNVSVTLPQGGTYNMFFSVESDLKLKTSKVLDTPQGQMTQALTFTDYQEVAGVKFPHQQTQSVGPQQVKMGINSIKVNQDLPEDTFKVN